MSYNSPKKSAPMGRITNSHSSTLNNSEKDLKSLMDSVIDADYLRKASLKDDLEDVTELAMIVNTSIQSLYDICIDVPNLSTLSLDHSTIASVRDLGVGFKCLLYLSMADCSLMDIDGIGALSLLRSLNLDDNMITEVSALAMHESLEELHLSGNNIMDISTTDTLSTCPNLKALFLSRNPIAKTPNYTLVIPALIPTLKQLDGMMINTTTKVSTSMILEAASMMKLMEEEMEDERRMEMGIMEEEGEEEDGNGGGVYGMSKSKSSHGKTVSSSSTGNKSEATATGTSTGDAGSELTYGSNNVVLAGSMASAMRQRRNQQGQSTFTPSHPITNPTVGSKSREGKAGVAGKDSIMKVFDTVHPITISNSDAYVEGDITNLYLPTETMKEESKMPLTKPRSGSRATPTAAVAAVDTTLDSLEPSGRKPPPSPSLTSRKNSGVVPAVAISSSRPSTGLSRPVSSVNGGGNTSRPTSSVYSSRTNSFSRPLSSDSSCSSMDGTSPRPGSASSITYRGLDITTTLPYRVGIPGEDATNKASIEKPSLLSLYHDSAFKSSQSLKTADKRAQQEDGNGSDTDSDANYYYNNTRGNRKVVLDASKIPVVGSDEEDEDEAVTHESRHQLMVSRKATAETTSIRGNRPLSALASSLSRTTLPSAKQAQDENNPSSAKAVVSKARKSTNKDDSDDDVEPIFSSNKPGKGKPNKPASSSVLAGLSLGFDLKGSLAAINQWVNDDGTDHSNLNSDSEDIDEPDRKSTGSYVQSTISTAFGNDNQRGNDSFITVTGGSSTMDGTNQKPSIRDRMDRLGNSNSTMHSTREYVSCTPTSGTNTSAAIPSSQSNTTNSTNATSGTHRKGIASTSNNMDVFLPEEMDYENDNESIRKIPSNTSTTAKVGLTPVVNMKPSATKPTTVKPVVKSPKAESKQLVQKPAAVEEMKPTAVVPVTAVPLAVNYSDRDLIIMLQDKPKNREELRTERGFKTFFTGVSQTRMKSLLLAAYNGNNATVTEECERKINKRMSLLQDVLVLE